MAKKPDRDIEKGCSINPMVAKLRRLADRIEQNKPFRLQIDGERITIPAEAILTLSMSENAALKMSNSNSSGIFK